MHMQRCAPVVIFSAEAQRSRVRRRAEVSCSPALRPVTKAVFRLSLPLPFPHFLLIEPVLPPGIMVYNYTFLREPNKPRGFLAHDLLIIRNLLHKCSTTAKNGPFKVLENAQPHNRIVGSAQVNG